MMFRPIRSAEEIIPGARLRMPMRAELAAYSDLTVTEVTETVVTAVRPYFFNGRLCSETMSMFKTSCLSHDLIHVDSKDRVTTY